MALGAFNNGNRQSQAGGYFKGVGFSGNAHDQPEGRPQGLDIKFHRGIQRARVIQRVFLQFTVMGGGHCHRMAAVEIVKQRDGQGCAFGGIRPRTQFIEQDLAIDRRPCPPVCNIFHVGGKRWTDSVRCSVHRRYPAKTSWSTPGSGFSRTGTKRPGLDHQRQPDGFQGYGLSPVLGPVMTVVSVPDSMVMSEATAFTAYPTADGGRTPSLVGMQEQWRRQPWNPGQVSWSQHQATVTLKTIRYLVLMSIFVPVQEKSRTKVSGYQR